MPVPPAATTARLIADLCMVAPEAIVTKRTSLNQSPDDPDQLVAPCGSRRGQGPGRFPSPQAIPPPRAHACENRCDHPCLSSGRPCEGTALCAVPAESCAEGGSWIAVIQRRFYDLAGAKATPISTPANWLLRDRIRCRKGLVNLLWIPIVNRVRGLNGKVL
jgi:hypothetical protein